MNSSITRASALSSAANNIVNISARSQGSMRRIVDQYRQFSRFLDIKTLELEKTELPTVKKIKDFSNINVVNSMGSVGGLISSLVSGAIDLGGLVRGIFKGKGNKIGAPQNTQRSTPRLKPQVKGGNLRLSGIRSLGVANALFAGLDFATGLAEGESVGKAAAGAGSALAGSLLGGAIGQALIPIPGVGFVLGSMVGGYLGGWLGDRTYEAVTGTGTGTSDRTAEEKQRQRLERSKKEKPDSIQVLNKQRQDGLLNKFNISVSNFSQFIDDILKGKITLDGLNSVEDESSLDLAQSSSNENENEVEGGELPTSYPITSVIGDDRGGRPHKGIDYGIPANLPISVIKPGKVTVARWVSGYGKAVYVKHADGIESIYGHLNRIDVEQGQDIQAGTVIGLSGNTGRSTGPHVHFELRKDDKAILTINANTANDYFRVGRVRVRPRTPPSGQPAAPGATGAPSGQQSSSSGQPAAPGATGAPSGQQSSSSGQPLSGTPLIAATSPPPPPPPPPPPQTPQLPPQTPATPTVAAAPPRGLNLLSNNQSSKNPPVASNSLSGPLPLGLPQQPNSGGVGGGRGGGGGGGGGGGNTTIIAAGTNPNPLHYILLAKLGIA